MALRQVLYVDKKSGYNPKKWAEERIPARILHPVGGFVLMCAGFHPSWCLWFCPYHRFKALSFGQLFDAFVWSNPNFQLRLARATTQGTPC